QYRRHDGRRADAARRYARPASPRHRHRHERDSPQRHAELRRISDHGRSAHQARHEAGRRAGRARRQLHSRAARGDERMKWSFLFLIFISLSVRSESIYTPAGPDGPAQTAYAPEKGAGPIVVVLSGALGMNHYQGMAADFARIGYYAILIEGNDVLTRQRDG